MPRPYFPASYLAPRYTPRELVGAAAGSATPGLGGPYVPGSCLSRAYCPGELVGGFPIPEDDGVAPALARSFLAALREAILADDGLVAGVPGGWWHRQAPPGLPDPVGVYILLPLTSSRDSSGQADSRAILQLSLYGPDPHALVGVASRASHLLLTLEASWQGGRLKEVAEGPAQLSIPPVPGRSGASSFAEVRQFVCHYQSAYDSP